MKKIYRQSMLIGGTSQQRWSKMHYYLKQVATIQCEDLGVVDFELLQTVKWIEKDVLPKGEGA